MILASASPRRVDLLKEAGFSFKCRPAAIDEAPLPNEEPVALVERLAKAKAGALIEGADPYEIVIGADTVVALDGEILGKPADAEDARRMLAALSGNTHQVATGVCLMAKGRGGRLLERVFSEVTSVTFLEIDPQDIDAYVRSGEPMDKAGAYAIQGRAKLFVDSICGNYENVVGLPLARCAREIASLGREI